MLRWWIGIGMLAWQCAQAQENPALLERIQGSVVLTEPVGGLLALDLPGLQRRVLRPANAGLPALMDISEPDAQGRIAVLSGGWLAGYTVTAVDAHASSTLFGGAGDPLWDKPLGPMAQAPDGRIAFVVQPPERAGKRFQPEPVGPLQLWEPQRQAVRALPVPLARGRVTWFPDGRLLIYMKPLTAADPACPRVLAQEAHLLDIEGGNDLNLGPGRLVLVADDGRSLLMDRGSCTPAWVLTDLAGRSERALAPGLHTPLALIGGRYVLERGPAPLAGMSEHNSPLVGPKPMQALRLIDLETRQFAIVLPALDPRTPVRSRLQLAPQP